jgi:hypothetical protein
MFTDSILAMRSSSAPSPITSPCRASWRRTIHRTHPGRVGGGHKTGIICAMDPISELAQQHGLIVYGDACQALMGEHRGRLSGLGSASGVSSTAEKTTGSGVGGCVLADDDALAERPRFVGQSRGVRMKAGSGGGTQSWGTFTG